MIIDALINGASNVLQWLATLLPSLTLPTLPTTQLPQFIDMANAFLPISETITLLKWFAGAAAVFGTCWLVWRTWFAIKW